MEKLIVNVETNETETITLTDKEIAEIEATLANTDFRLSEQAKAEAKAASAKTALLEKLGITEDEARLLLG